MVKNRIELLVLNFKLGIVISQWSSTMNHSSVYVYIYILTNKMQLKNPMELIVNTHKSFPLCNFLWRWHWATFEWVCERECIIMVHCMCECCGTAKWRHWSSWWRPHCRTDWITRMNCMVVLPMLLLCMFTLIGSTANQRICFGHREPRPYGQVIAPTIGTMRTTMVPVNMHSTTTTTSLRYKRKVSNL